MFTAPSKYFNVEARASLLKPPYSSFSFKGFYRTEATYLRKMTILFSLLELSGSAGKAGNNDPFLAIMLHLPLCRTMGRVLITVGICNCHNWIKLPCQRQKLASGHKLTPLFLPLVASCALTHFWSDALPHVSWHDSAVVTCKMESLKCS